MEFIKKHGQFLFNILITAALLGLLLLNIFGGKKIGFIDNSLVLQNATIQKEAMIKFEGKIEEFKNEIANKEQEIQILNDLKEKSEDTAIIENELSVKLSEYEAYVKEVNEKLNSFEIELLTPVYSTINKSITEYGKKNGYYLILGANVDGNVVYGNNIADISLPVVNYLNKMATKVPEVEDTEN